jgi:hypothetical protein
LSFFAWLILFHISMLVRMTEFYSFYSWTIFHCTHIPYFLYLFICQWTSSLIPYLGYCEQCCSEHVTPYKHEGSCQHLSHRLDFNSFGYIPSSGIAGSYDSSISSFLRYLILFSIIAILIYIPTSSVGGFSFPHSCQHLSY